MNEPVIGPILVLQEYKNEKELVEYINQRELKGSMAQYFFGECTSNTAKTLLAQTTTGVFIYNDTFLPFLNSNLPISGVADAGWGAHYGQSAFEQMSVNRAICEKSQSKLLDVEARYPNPNDSQEKKM